MKVHKQKAKNRILVALMCLSIMMASLANPIQVHASEATVNSIVIDVALTKTGILANSNIGKSIEGALQSAMRNALIEYDEWIDENGITEISPDTFYEYCSEAESDSAGAEIMSYEVLGLLYEPAVNNWISAYRQGKEKEIDFVEMTTGEKAEKGKNVTISDKFVKYVRKLFDEYAKTESDYFYVNSLSPDNINPLWFSSIEMYEKVKAYASTISDLQYWVLNGTNSSEGKMLTTGSDNGFETKSINFYYLDSTYGYVVNDYYHGSGNYTYYVDMYNSQWTPTPVVINGTYEYSNMIATELELIEKGSSIGKASVQSILGMQSKYTTGHLGFVSSDGRPVRIFKTLNAFKVFSVGMQPYYVTNNSQDYSTTDNSVTVGGDYITGSNYQYSHDVVQNQIDNSETVDNSVVNNIVNDNSQTIINNYASSVVPEGGSEGDGDGGGLGGILDGLGSIFSGLADIVGFLLGIIGDVIGLIGDLFQTVFNGIKAIGEIFAGFTGLLGSLFPFIPEELVTFLTLAVEACVGVAIWRQFKKG